MLSHPLTAAGHSGVFHTSHPHDGTHPALPTGRQPPARFDCRMPPKSGGAVQVWFQSRFKFRVPLPGTVAIAVTVPARALVAALPAEFYQRPPLLPASSAETQAMMAQGRRPIPDHAARARARYPPLSGCTPLRLGQPQSTCGLVCAHAPRVPRPHSHSARIRTPRFSGLSSCCCIPLASLRSRVFRDLRRETLRLGAENELTRESPAAATAVGRSDVHHPRLSPVLDPLPTRSRSDLGVRSSAGTAMALSADARGRSSGRLRERLLAPGTYFCDAPEETYTWAGGWAQRITTLGVSGVRRRPWARHGFGMP
ncbi:hypothetical protein C8Q78DRAFT_425675 [Trametes maxima]|nr:hypothetical protein C8Q78DRAFT_425675 [Trametes maxima]